ncbi:MAG TPA: formylglycine-generating enzyme family protein [Polyangiaceae bacterium]|nr:formylglycine-generating enzyme family protein [Polyangiaceae bacterium]
MAAGALFVAAGVVGCGERDVRTLGDTGGSSGANTGGSSGASAAGGSGGASQNVGSSSGASCAGMNGRECQDGSCCARLPVPGGTFGQGDPDAFSSTVSSFTLDAYEVTVGRFRNFVAAYDAWRAAGNPTAGSGANANVPESGWDPSFGDSLPKSADELTAAAQCGVETYFTWASAGNDTLPINCVDWYTSFAFCIWDGGRLPTEAEWEYAAARGADNTLYPWGDSPVPDNTLNTGNLAVYNCMGDGDASGCTFADILPVGSRPDGNGRFGQSDLAGSVWEWDLDWYADYPTTPQTNYANLVPSSARMIRGGDWSSGAATLVAAGRYSYGFPTAHFTNVGFRCAGNP